MIIKLFDKRYFHSKNQEAMSRNKPPRLVKIHFEEEELMTQLYQLNFEKEVLVAQLHMSGTLEI